MSLELYEFDRALWDFVFIFMYKRFFRFCFVRLIHTVYTVVDNVSTFLNYHKGHTWSGRLCPQEIRTVKSVSTGWR